MFFHLQFQNILAKFLMLKSEGLFFFCWYSWKNVQTGVQILLGSLKKNSKPVRQKSAILQGGSGLQSPLPPNPHSILRTIWPEFNLWGSRDGSVLIALASHQGGLGSTPRHGDVCWPTLLLVLVLAPRVFLLGPVVQKRVKS